MRSGAPRRGCPGHGARLAQGRTFVWRGVTEQGSLDSRLYQAASALDTLSGMAQVNAALADAAGLTRPSDAAALAGLLDHLSVQAAWATGRLADCGHARCRQRGRRRARRRLAEIAACEQDVGRAAGVPWPAVPRSAALPAVDRRRLAALVPAAAET